MGKYTLMYSREGDSIGSPSRIHSPVVFPIQGACLAPTRVRLRVSDSTECFIYALVLHERLSDCKTIQCRRHQLCWELNCFDQ